MPTVTNLTQQQIDKIQIDEGVIFIDYGLPTEMKLGPTRGGGEFNATQTVRDIEFDGRVGKTAGMQVIESQEADLKVNSLCTSQEMLKKAFPNCRISGTKVKNAKAGVIPAGPTDSAYAKNVTMFAKLMDGSFKKITIYNPMHEGAIAIKAVQKAENELALDFQAHYGKEDLNGDLYEIDEVDAFGAPEFVSAETTTATKVSVTFSHEMSATGLVAGDFTVKESDAAKTVSSVALNTDKHVVELTVSASLTAGKTITVAYTKGTAKDTEGVLLESFPAKLVTNNL